jgi:acyl-CoA-binding protein
MNLRVLLIHITDKSYSLIGVSSEVAQQRYIVLVKELQAKYA